MIGAFECGSADNAPACRIARGVATVATGRVMSDIWGKGERRGGTPMNKESGKEDGDAERGDSLAQRHAFSPGSGGGSLGGARSGGAPPAPPRGHQRHQQLCTWCCVSCGRGTRGGRVPGRVGAGSGNDSDSLILSFAAACHPVSSARAPLQCRRPYGRRPTSGPVRGESDVSARSAALQGIPPSVLEAQLSETSGAT